MEKNKIPDINSWNLQQLVRIIATDAMDKDHIHTMLQSAYDLTNSIDYQITKRNTAKFRYLDESLQIAMVAVQELSLGLSAVTAIILAPPFLMGFLQKEEISKRFDKETLAILIELYDLRRHHPPYDIFLDYLGQLNNSSPLITAVLLQICDIVHLYCSGVMLESQNNLLFLITTNFLFDLKHFYIPFAHRMRLYDIQTRLADFWLKHANTISYYAIIAKLGITKLQRQKMLNLVAEEVNGVMEERKISFTMKKRIKSIYSIWHKMQQLSMDVNQINDLSAIRIIIRDATAKTLEEEKVLCWKVLAIISTLYKPIGKVMRDWVSQPKENGYESLHLSFDTYQYGRLEVQIRTERMDYIAEYGKAAHWRYKYTP